MTIGIERMLPQRQLDRTATSSSASVLCAKWRVSKLAHEKAAQRLKNLATHTTGERKLEIQKRQLEHLQQANFLKDKLDEMEV